MVTKKKIDKEIEEIVQKQAEEEIYKKYLYGTVDILGETFSLYVIPRKYDKKLAENDDLEGYTDYTVNKIVCEAFEQGGCNQEDLDVLVRRVLRHEVLHAFMFRCGLDASSEWGRNEELIDFFAIKFPDLMKIYAELEIDKK